MSHKSLSIVYVWDADYPWDVRTEKVTLALTRAGHNVNIVARNNAWRQKTELLPEGTVHRMPPWRLVGNTLDRTLGFPAFFSPRWIRLIDKTCREANADVIIVRDLPLCPTAIGVAKRLNIPVVLDMAENYPAMMRVLWETGRNTVLDYAVRNPVLTQELERRCVRAVDQILVVVEESADRVAALGVPRDKLTIVSNTPPLARLDSPAHVLGNSRERLEVVYMGNLEVVRGLLESVDAIAELKAAGSLVRLRIIGRGRDEALIRSHCAGHELGTEDVEFLGYVESHAEALRIVADSDIGLMPHRKNESWDTTIPNKMFDYMAAGLPVVSSNAAPCERILRETNAGRVFQSGNSHSIASVLGGVARPGVGAALGAAGRQAIRDRYNWEHDTHVLLEVIDGVGSDTQGRRQARN
ncbi:MAG: glycosyltransferase [Gemmatimonadaceae bacterium]